MCKHKGTPTWLFIVLLILWVSDAKAQTNWTQDWSGKLNISSEMSLTLVLHIKQKEGQYLASLDSVDQGAMGIPASKVKIENNDLVLEFSNIGAQFKGEHSGTKINGTFHQGGQKFPLSFAPISQELKQQISKTSSRPQEPKAPYPYLEEEVNYSHVEQKFTFAGTLTKPKGEGPFAAAILVSGSGPQDRDSNIMNHKPFKLLADHLTRLGFAVLRSDDRGTGQSKGTFSGTTINEFSYDVESAFNYLSTRSDINPSHIGLIGHSEGGITAPLFAARQPKVAFVIMLAGLGVPGTELWATQQKELGLAAGLSDGKAIYDMQLKAAQMSKNKASFDELVALFNTIPNANKALIDTMAKMLSSPWGHSFMAYQPKNVLSKLKMPLLAINGDLDIQVKAKDNLDSLRKIMLQTKNKDVTISSLPGLNHLFQRAKTGYINEYAKITETMDPNTLKLIGQWLTNRF